MKASFRIPIQVGIPRRTRLFAIRYSKYQAIDGITFLLLSSIGHLEKGPLVSWKDWLERIGISPAVFPVIEEALLKACEDSLVTDRGGTDFPEAPISFYSLTEEGRTAWRKRILPLETKTAEVEACYDPDRKGWTLRAHEWTAEYGDGSFLPLPSDTPEECFRKAKGSAGFPIGKEDEILKISPLDEDFVAVEKRAASFLLDERGWELKGISSFEADYLDHIGEGAPYELGLAASRLRMPSADGLALLNALESILPPEREVAKEIGPQDLLLLAESEARQGYGASPLLPLPSSAPLGTLAVGYSSRGAFAWARYSVRAPLLRDGKMVETIAVPALCRLRLSNEESAELARSAILSIPEPLERISLLAFAEGKGYLSGEAEKEALPLLRGTDAPEFLDGFLVPLFEENGLEEPLDRLSQAVFAKLLEEGSPDRARTFVLGHARRSRSLEEVALAHAPQGLGRTGKYLLFRSLGFPLSSASRMTPPLPIDCPRSEIPADDPLHSLLELRESAGRLAELLRAGSIQGTALEEVESCARKARGFEPILKPFSSSCPTEVAVLRGECEAAIRQLNEWNEGRLREDEGNAVRSLLRQGNWSGAALRASGMLEETLRVLLPQTKKQANLQSLLAESKEAGLITKEEFARLDAFRVQRNEFAHARKKAEGRDPEGIARKISDCLDVVEKLRRNL